MLNIAIDGPGAPGIQLSLSGIEDGGAIADADLVSLAQDIAASDAVRGHFTGPASPSAVLITRAIQLYP